MRPDDVIDRLRGGLVVSCQAYPGEPMRDPRTMAQVAASALRGGAAGIRVQGIADIRAVADLPVPVIGLWKDGEGDVFITPSLEHAIAVADAGADVVAIDGTRRPRADGLTLAETVRGLRERTDALIMADCGSVDDAIAAEQAGVDILGTTLSGYTGERTRTDGPDLELIRLIAERCALPIMAEGRIHTPAQAAAALSAGAASVCVGTAITHPASITSWFVTEIEGIRR
ncbi:N-acetylmannosamine-6-phosphate 2-epimerase [Microbacterium sp. 179-I 3D4 NHS]|uniref:N-acetylmannosamine-6-phosphate 2-epimerase n=1 Tax=Microbacterium sp. 179-I 3D4 NHS TaxID=3142381 RepID=UPI0039A27B65